MKILTEIHRNKGINIHGKTVHRTAVRAVIRRGRELLMVYSSAVGDYKFLILLEFVVLTKMRHDWL
ncbi:hypothetical protein JZU46_06070, partial [bacterium]|nr:hypothetical protein [bacterium]